MDVVILDTSDNPEDWKDSSGAVEADLIVKRREDGSHIVQIHCWFCHDRGKGHTSTALAELSAQFPGIITAHDIGTRGEASYSYWVHQLKKHRVHRIYNTVGRRVVLRRKNVATRLVVNNTRPETNDERSARGIQLHEVGSMG